MSASVLAALAVLALLLASSAAGATVQALLPDRHRTSETIDAVRTAVSMIVTFSAVVLGLLTSSASGTYSEVQGRLRGYSAVLIQLNRELREYGSEADPLRERLRSYTAAAIADTWKQETPPPGDYYPKHFHTAHPGDLDNETLARMLQSVELALLQLNPQDPFHQRLAQESLGTMERLLDLRWRLIESARNGLSAPVLAVLMLWLAIVFGCLGLTAPRNVLSYTVTACSTFVLASSVFLLLELNEPFSGDIVVSSTPFRDALAHMTP